MLPNKFTTAIEMATSSLFFVMDGAKAAMAEEPQILVPNPINQPEVVGHLTRLAK